MPRVLANRLRNRFKHLSKWARRSGVSCFRVYERDIPDQPCIVDWYDGDAVVWLYGRLKDETPDAAADWEQQVMLEVGEGLGLPPERIHRKRRGRQRGASQYTRIDQQGITREVAEQGLRFAVNLSDYLDTGLFLDHRLTRALVRDRAAGRDLLNLFAYTGSFSCYAAAGGASSSLAVDLSKTYSDWTRRNLVLNGCDPARHGVQTADCMHFLEQPPERRYSLIVCDPPTFSNSKRMDRTWAVERDHPWLLWRLAEHLAPGGELVFSTNCRGFELAASGLPPLHYQEITARTVPPDFERVRPHRCWLITKRG